MSKPNQIEIRVWLIRRKITIRQIAKDLRISDSAVSQAISGRTPHYKGERVLEWLRRHGCPECLLDETKGFEKVG